MHYKCNKCPESISHLITFRSRSYWEPLHKWTKNIHPFHIHLPAVNFVVYTFPRFPFIPDLNKKLNKGKLAGSSLWQTNKTTKQELLMICHLGIKSKKRVDEFPWKRQITQHKVALFKFRSLVKTQKCDESRFLNRNIVIHCHTMPIVHIAIVFQ